MYFIYNTVTEMGYVGLTTHRMRDRVKQHLRHAKEGVRLGALYAAMREWPLECWEAVVLERCNDIDSLLEAERRWIVATETHLPAVGYNVEVPTDKHMESFKREFLTRPRREFKAERVGFYDLDGRVPWLVEAFVRAVGHEGAKDGGREAARKAMVLEPEKFKRKTKADMTPEEIAFFREAGRLGALKAMEEDPEIFKRHGATGAAGTKRRRELARAKAKRHEPSA